VAREIPAANAGRLLPLVGTSIEPAAGAPPAIWVSEAMVDLYGARVGDVLRLPLAGRERPFTVAGVWRDYGRQFGSVALDVGAYVPLTGDEAVSDAALWLRPGTDTEAVQAALQSALAGSPGIEIVATGALRALSLRIFDRSFAVTWVLELAAIVIGLIGVAASFSAQALARAREFGVLRHLGMTRRQILAVLGLEAAFATGNAVLVGLVAGGAVALVLVHVVNRQSFHWSMDLSFPAGMLALLGIALILCAALSAALAGRSASGASPLRAVHEDA
jgi:putative ABC transport system permease protein